MSSKIDHSDKKYVFITHNPTHEKYASDIIYLHFSAHHIY